MHFLVSISQHFAENFLYLWVLAVMLGSWTVLTELWKFVDFVYAKTMRKRVDFAKRYGKGSWALITGSSQGIGKAFALGLARQKFNIILSARTQSKLKETKQEIQKLYPQIQVKYIVTDFCKDSDLKSIEQGWYRRNGLHKLEISILINNAGMDCLDPFEKLSLDYLLKLIQLDCLFLKSTNYLFLKRWKEEGIQKNNQNRKLIVNVSSTAADIMAPYFTTYNACKIYVDKLTQANAIQYPEFDFMSLKPSEVTTRLTCHKQDFFSVTPKQCVEPLLDDISYRTYSYGPAFHAVQAWFYRTVPECIFNIIWKKIVYPEFKKSREDFAKKDKDQGNKSKSN